MLFALMDKGTASNLASAGLFGLGLLLPRSLGQDVILNVGLFAFSGGITNALAVKMLFDRIPGLIGSGVIPARFKEIRLKVKNLILEHFFDAAHLREFFSSEGAQIDWKRYVKSTGTASHPLASFVGSHWDKVASSEVVQPIVDEQINKLMDSSIGGLLAMMGPDAIKPAVTQFINGFLGSLRTRVLELAASSPQSEMRLELDQERLIADVRTNVDVLLTRKLEQLDAQQVKRMMEDVIRNHLGWLVVWGNVFGGMLGFVPVLLQALGS